MRMLKWILGVAVAGADLAAAMTMTASAAPQFVKGTVDANGGLKGRIAPSVHTTSNYLFKDGAKVSIGCRTKGTIVGGNAEWYLISGEGDARWVSAKYVDLAGAKPGWCGPDTSISVKITKDTYSYPGPVAVRHQAAFRRGRWPGGVLLRLHQGRRQRPLGRHHRGRLGPGLRGEGEQDDPVLREVNLIFDRSAG